MFRHVYFKEMKDSFRDRRTLFLTVFLPIIMMTVLTFVYESMLSAGDGEETYTIAVEDSISIEEEQLLIMYENIELNKTNDPEQTVLEGDALAGVIFSEDFISRVEHGEDASVTLIGDPSSQNASILMMMISDSLDAFEQTIITERLQAEGTDPSLIQPFTIQEKSISEDNAGTIMLSILIPIILAIGISIGASPAAADLFAGEKERKTMEALLMTPVNRSTLLSAKWLTIVSTATITGVVTLIVVFIEIFFFTENLKAGLNFGDNLTIIVVMALLVNFFYAMFCASLMMFTSIIAKTVKEANSYISPIMMLMMFPAFFTTTIGINEFTMFHFVTPLVNIFSIYKELLYGVVNYEHILTTILSNLVVVIVMFIISRMLFMKDKWVLN